MSDLLGALLGHTAAATAATASSADAATACLVPPSGSRLDRSSDPDPDLDLDPAGSPRPGGLPTTRGMNPVGYSEPDPGPGPDSFPGQLCAQALSNLLWATATLGHSQLPAVDVLRRMQQQQGGQQGRKGTQ